LTRFTGFLPDPRRPVGALIGSAIRARRVGLDLPRSTSLLNWHRPQQQHANDCVLQSMRQMAYVWCGSRGLDIPNLSSYFGYWATRRHVWMRSEMMDRGSYPTSAIWAVKKFGLCTEKDWPSTRPLDAGTEPWSWSWMLGRKHRLDCRTIYDNGDNLILRIKDCLVKGYPVMLALRVDDAFTRDHVDGTDDERIAPPTNPTNMAHAVTAVGYEPGYIRIVNSWGITWRTRGTALLSNEYVKEALHVSYCKEVMLRA